MPNNRKFLRKLRARESAVLFLKWYLDELIKQESAIKSSDSTVQEPVEIFTMLEVSNPLTVGGGSAVIVKWFLNEEFYWRSVASGIWSLGIFNAMITTFILICNFSIFSPLKTISTSLGNLFSIKAILSFICLNLVCFATNKIHRRNLQVKKVTHKNTANFLLHLLRPKQISSILAFLAIVLTTAFLLKRLTDYTFSYDVNIFVLTAAIFMAVFYSVEYYHENRNVVLFPVINERRFFRVKKIVIPSCKSALLNSLKILKYYYPIYIIFGYLPRLLLKMVSGESCGPLLTSLYSLFDLSIFWLLLCVMTTIIAMMDITNKVLHIFNTQHYEFAVETATHQVAGDSERTLMHAMRSDNELLKSLACYDLYLSSKFPSKRRSKMFELTSPGNQPHIWNCICAEFLKLIEQQHSNIKGEIERKERMVKLQQQKISSPIQSPTNTVGVQYLFSPASTSTAIKQRPVSSITKESTKSPIEIQKEINKSVVQQSEKPNLELCDDFQLLCWTIQGISNLVAVSIDEDKYGVVQRKLADILSSMLDLLEMIDTFTKTTIASPVASSYHQHLKEFQKSQRNIQLIHSMKIVLKSSIYNITTSFGYHINAVRLSNAHMKKLNEFLQFNT